MLKVIIGTPQKCMEWAAGTNDDADYTNYINFRSGIALTKTLDKGGITGLVEPTQGFQRSFVMYEYGGITPAAEGSLFFLLHCDNDRTIHRIFFGGILTQVSDSYIGFDSENNPVTLVDLRATSFEWEFCRNKIDLNTIINQYVDTLVDMIVRKYCDSNICQRGTVVRPAERLRLVKLNRERRPWSVFKSIEGLYENSSFYVEPVLSADFAGCSYHFVQNEPVYAPVVLNDDLKKSVGPHNVDVTPNLDSIKNVVDVEFWTDAYRDPEFDTQVTTDNVAELKSSFVLAGIPLRASSGLICRDDYSDQLVADDYVHTDIDNSSPPELHTADEGYLLEGEYNGVFGLHFLDATAESPDYGQIALVSKPEYILFETLLNTSMRMKELQVNTRGNAIVCAYYNSDTISSAIISVTSASCFAVEDGSKFAANELVTVNNETRVVSSVLTNTIILKAALTNTPEIDDVCSLANCTKSRVIFGLELKSDGTLAKVEKGVSIALSSKTYNASTAYTIRNHCVQYETWTISATSGATLTVSDNNGFAANDIVELHEGGNNTAPVEYKISSVGEGTIILTESPGSIAANIRIRTKPKARLQINGGGSPVDASAGKYGEVSGREWQTLAEMTNTIQTEPRTEREVGFCVALQKSLVATLKELNVKHYPPIEVICNGVQKNCSTADDSAEMDVDCFLVNNNGKYSIEFPSDTKADWARGTRLEVRYKERKLSKIRRYHTESLKEVAEQRGNPIVETDTREQWSRKGGLMADVEQRSQNVLSLGEASQLSQSVLKNRVQEKLSIRIKNLSSKYHGHFEPGMILTVDLSKFPTTREAVINQVVGKLVGLSAGEPFWVYEIQANVEDRVSDLIAAAGKQGKNITDDSGENTIEETEIYEVNELIEIDETAFSFQDGYSNDFWDSTTGQGRDIRKLCAIPEA